MFRVGFIAAAVVTVYGAVAGRDRWQWFAKPLMMPLLAMDVARSDAIIAPGDRALLLGALGAATVGDILLIDPDDDRRLIAGASSFAVMHAGYSALWWRRGARPRVEVALPRIVAWLAMGTLLHVKAPSVAAPLTAYGATLSTAAVLASDPGLAAGAKTVARPSVPNSDPCSRLGVGALLFTLSDASIVLRRLFARTVRSRRITEGVVLATYAAGQYLLTGHRIQPGTAREPAGPKS